jgi:hypothetical protein
VVDVVGDHAAQQADVVHAAGHVRKQLAHFDARLAVLLERPRRAEQIAGLGPLQRRLREWQRLARIARESRLGVEGIDVRRPARHEEEYDPLRARRVHGRPHGERTGGRLPSPQQWGSPRRGPVLKQRREAEHAESVAAYPQHVPPRVDGRSCVVSGVGLFHDSSSFGQTRVLVVSAEFGGHGRRLISGILHGQELLQEAG